MLESQAPLRTSCSRSQTRYERRTSTKRGKLHQKKSTENEERDFQGARTLHFTDPGSEAGGQPSTKRANTHVADRCLDARLAQVTDR